jgi:hypothetical protein
MKDLIARPDAATGKTTAKETTKKWVCIVQYEHSDGSINQIIDEFPTKEEAYEAMKSTYERYQWMNRCFNYENPWAYITDESACTNSTMGDTIRLWVKKKTGKMSWLRNAKKLDDIERELTDEFERELKSKFGVGIKEINEMLKVVNNTK